MNRNSIPSPIAKGYNAIFQKSISVPDLIAGYCEQLGLDVNNYFLEIEELSIYECEKTKYRFYYPFGISGDSSFYQKLEKFPWYYMPWKWEHEVTRKLLSGGEKILEVGSGGLGFVQRLQDENFEITGLELNQQSILEAQAKNLNILSETIEKHSETNSECYDIVCSYQVVEHIEEVHSFIKAQINCLKVGGKLIISVPNNDSFLGYDVANCLNMPPHHMGLWNEQALKNLSSIFNLKLEKIFLEPLQSYHKAYFSNVMIKYFLKKSKPLEPFSNKIVPKFFPKVIPLFPKRLKAFTIQAVYRKL